jgi:hypothetical protein
VFGIQIFIQTDCSPDLGARPKEAVATLLVTPPPALPAGLYPHSRRLVGLSVAQILRDSLLDLDQESRAALWSWMVLHRIPQCGQGFICARGLGRVRRYQGLETTIDSGPDLPPDFWWPYLYFGIGYRHRKVGRADPGGTKSVKPLRHPDEFGKSVCLHFSHHVATMHLDGRFALIQKGPSFKQPMDTLIDASTGQVKVRYTDNGKEQMVAELLELPADIANGLLFTLMKDVKPSVPRTTVSMLATTPKPRLINLAILPHGEEPFTIGSFRHKAMHYVVKVEIGGVAGFLARLMGKQPPDMHVWVLGGEAPAFVKSEGPLYAGGPIWRIQLASAGAF